MKYPGVVIHLNIMLSVITIVSLAQQKNSAAATCPCDIYKNGGTPCIAAHSTVRLLLSTYTGPFYQVRRSSDNTTKDIYAVSGGTAASAASQDSFCTGTSCVITKVYDQSGKGNFVEYQGKGSSVGGVANPAVATSENFPLGGHKVYSVYIQQGMSYWRNGSSSGVPTGAAPEGVYMVTSGKHSSNQCCFDYGNSETDRKPDGGGTMDAVNFSSITMWGTGAGSGPWVMADLEFGLFSQGSNNSKNQNDPTQTSTYVTALIKNNGTTQFAIKGGNATSGSLGTYYKGSLPSGYNPMKKQGAIVLGSGGDCCPTNLNLASGTFYEGAIVSGYPSDSTDDAIQANIVRAGYGSNTPVNISNRSDNTLNTLRASSVNVSYTRSITGAVMSYALQHARRVSVDILDQRGRRIAAVADGIVPAGRHEAVWDAKRVRAGVYVCRIEIDGMAGWTGRIIVEK